MKSVVRHDVLNKIRMLSREERQQHSSLIQKKLQGVLADQKGVWGAYQSLSDEPEIQWSAISSEIEWAFPQLQTSDMQFVQSETFQKSALGFSEPVGGQPVMVHDLQGVVIPAVAYDRAGRRLGRGKGYYDRALHGFTGTKIGVCFEISLCEELPHEEHDIQCDLVVTEKAVYPAGQAFEGVSKWN